MPNVHVRPPPSASSASLPFPGVFVLFLLAPISMLPRFAADASFFAAPLPSASSYLHRFRRPISFGGGNPSASLRAKKGGGFGGAGGGGGGGFGGGKLPTKKKKSGGGGGAKNKGNLLSNLNDEPSPSKQPKKSNAQTYVKSEQDALLQQLASDASRSVIGKAVAESPLYGTPDMDNFWELIPSLISSKFPTARDDELRRVAGFVRHALDPNLPLEDSIVEDEWRPHDEIHAYMPGLGERSPFLDPDRLELCSLLSANYDVIKAEYEALLRHMAETRKDRFQSVTSMNYESGWKTLVLFYNGHRIPDFPYKLCPTTTSILESVPLAGRIAGFNRQRPGTGIPLHSDGNNMWLTCQMGVQVPRDDQAWIRVGPETRHWEEGKCLLYDTTYEHETFNGSTEEERVVLHVDFFNTLQMTKLEIDVMRYVYAMREEFMKAEGVAKVGAQIL